MAKKKRAKGAKKVPKYEVVHMNVQDINVSDYNPRKMTSDGKKALRKSLDEYGLLENLIYNKRTNRLIGGHQRLQILKEKGYDEVPVCMVDIPEDEEKILNLTLNNEFVGGEWDVDQLAKLRDDIRDNRPDAYDSLLLFKLRNFEKMESGRSSSGGSSEKFEIFQSSESNHPDMEIQPYEHYDYVVFFFKDQRDFQVALQKLGVKMVNHAVTGRQRIGIGRCLSGEKLLEALE